MSREFEDKLSQYRRQLRKQQIGAIKASSRMQLKHQLTLAQVDGLLSPHPEGQSLTVLSVFQRCREVLLDPFGGGTVSEDIILRIPLNLHVTFWHQYLHFLLNNLSISYPVIPELVAFLMEFQNRYEWSQVS